MTKIVVADLGTGNLRSVSKALAFVSNDTDVSISADTEAIENSEYLVLPGQGAIGTWFNQINSSTRLKNAILNRLDSGPVLGICLGLQALYSSSEENDGTEGLGILAGRVMHFSSNPLHNTQAQDVDHRTKLKIPHMGWNQVQKCIDHPLWHGIDDNERFYFVHSYYVESENSNQVMGECEYGNKFTAAAGTNNIFATQFHPEKSQHAGLQLLKNFINWNGVS
jgi:glutamine amidotransferase